MWRNSSAYNVIVEPLDCIVDLVFVLDQSNSVGSSNFELMKSFLSRLVDRVDIYRGNTRVGLVTYSTDISTAFNLSDHSSVDSIKMNISSIMYVGGDTNTAVAFQYVRTEMLSAEAGDRPNVPNVVALLTDGQSQDTRDMVVSIILLS